MPARPVVVGAGVNGLIAAFYLARAGLRPIVLERQDRVGGAIADRELAPGVRVPRLAHAVNPLRPDIAADLQLAAAGVQWIAPDIASFTPALDGPPLVLARDPWKAAAALTRHSERDAARYPEFLRSVAAIGGLLADLASTPPPSIDTPSAAEVWRLLKTARRFRALGRPQAFRALRWGPQAVADLVEDWFETDLLRATLATRGVFGTAFGVRSAGSAAVLLLDAARQPDAPLAPLFVRGGPHTFAAALAVAASQAGAEVRCGAEVTHIRIKDDTVAGVVLESGEQIDAAVVVSNLDPQRTLLGLVDPLRLEPGFVARVRNYRARGTVAKVNLVLDRLPQFPSAAQLPGGISMESALSGRILVAPGLDALEQAFDASKYGTWSARPWLECTIPTIADSTLAPPGTHVMSIYAQYAPFELRGTSWAAERDRFTAAVIEMLAGYAPDLRSRIVTAETLTPSDIEGELGTTGGHVYHGELALDQLFVMRPVPGWAQHRTPVRGLYLCGAGTHPGGGTTGANGANAAGVVIADVRRGRATREREVEPS